MANKETTGDLIAVPKTVLRQIFESHDDLLSKAEPNNLGGFDSEDCELCGTETVHSYDPRGTGHGICLHCSD